MSSASLLAQPTRKRLRRSHRFSSAASFERESRTHVRFTIGCRDIPYTGTFSISVMSGDACLSHARRHARTVPANGPPRRGYSSRRLRRLIMHRIAYVFRASVRKKKKGWESLSLSLSLSFFRSLSLSLSLSLSRKEEKEKNQKERKKERYQETLNLRLALLSRRAKLRENKEQKGTKKKEKGEREREREREREGERKREREGGGEEKTKWQCTCAA